MPFSWLIIQMHVKQTETGMAKRTRGQDETQLSTNSAGICAGSSLFHCLQKCDVIVRRGCRCCRCCCCRCCCCRFCCCCCRRLAPVVCLHFHLWRIKGRSRGGTRAASKCPSDSSTPPPPPPIAPAKPATSMFPYLWASLGRLHVRRFVCVCMCAWSIKEQRTGKRQRNRQCGQLA